MYIQRTDEEWLSRTIHMVEQVMERHGWEDDPEELKLQVKENRPETFSALSKRLRLAIRVVAKSSRYRTQ
jgi:hypothetical protein